MYTMLYFYSHLVYGIQVLGSACDSHIGTIQVLQKRVVRLIPGPLPASSPLFVKLGLLKLNVSMFIHKWLYLRTSDNFNEWFILNH